MAREYRYADAVRLLGGDDPAVRALDTVLGAATLGLWDLIDAKGELIRVGNDLLGRWRDWRAGKEWRGRTDRIEAAHTILVLTAFFEALDGIELPFSARELRMSKTEQVTLLRGVDLGSPVCPSPQLPFEEAKSVILVRYERLRGALRSFAEGLSLWERLQEHQREWVFDSSLATAAIRRYEDGYRRLAMDVPEFGFWSAMVEHQATRARLADLERLLDGLAPARAQDARLAALGRLHQAALRRPVAETGDVPAGLALPSLGDAYVTPRFRSGRPERAEDPSQEAWWSEREVRDGLPRFLAGYLTSPEAGRTPLMVLGQPGAGKSVLTKVLAARLPADFVPVRVPLRDVAAGADVQEQIEQAVYQLSGERLHWPDLARAADGALPVVILDGFDELLQATGVRQSDYLAKVARFQQRELDAGRAVAVIVTSRTAVADRVDYPEGSLVTRLEPFDLEEIEQWLEVWNHANAAYFDGAGLRPLSMEVARAQRNLAEQPLLLLMLALYDAYGNALRRNLADRIGEAELYERLMRAFAERELEKSHPRERIPALVEKELLLLGIVAFAMFNRGRQWATAAEVDADLEALRLSARRPTSLATPLTAGEQAFGRFFFVHQAQATRDGGEILQTYEFLHATFGEFLIARLIGRLLDDMLVQESRLVVEEVSDGMLGTLLSWSTLSTRPPVISFLRESADPAWRGLATRLFALADLRDQLAHPAYRPWTAGPARRNAYYTANLLKVALACDPARLLWSRVRPGHEDPLTEWRRFALLWRSQLANEEWDSLIRVVRATSVGGAADLELALDTGSTWDLTPMDTSWIAPPDSGAYLRARQGVLFSFLPHETLFLHALEPVLGAALSWNGGKSLLREILEILVLRGPNGDGRARSYLALAEYVHYLSDHVITEAVTRAIAGDMATLADNQVSEVVDEVSRGSIAGQRLMSRILRLHSR
ncbi:NACHT domain-containing protein [Nonomuraea sp. NPDC050394]|uniref:NACHT domain-containing protein n=1 Tax=Nonomuraea sp. NPDC050394 TaxID=3364363 RepID=UPI0037B01B4D